jgi:hypothetical protein
MSFKAQIEMKQEERNELDGLVNEFLAKGGEITKVTHENKERRCCSCNNKLKGGTGFFCNANCAGAYTLKNKGAVPKSKQRKKGGKRG